MQRPNTLGARLSGALPYVTRGGKVIDVGTDHAYLPIALIEQGLCTRALACDINVGPLDSARENIQASGLSEKIETLLTDGLHGTRDFAPDDVLIFGMGGELIVRILSEASFTRQLGKRLILQPQTHAELVRAYLFENGFRILAETVAQDDGDRLYQIITAEYDGVIRVVGNSYEDRLALLCGARGMGQDEALYCAVPERLSAVYAARVAGKRRTETNAEKDGTEEDEALLSCLSRILSDMPNRKE
jgi:tRNA (adenine22-N1)-methyltransferase